MRLINTVEMRYNICRLSYSSIYSVK